MLRSRYILSEDTDDIIDSSQEINTVENTAEINAPAAVADIGITQMISDLIKDEWEAIDGYKSTIATLKSLGGHEDIIKVLEDIFPEELVHVGQLEKIMELVTPQASEISDGKEEAAEQMSKSVEPSVEPTTNESVVFESCKKHHKKPLKEEYTYSGKGYADYMCYWMEEVLGEVDNLLYDEHDDSELVQKLRQLNDDGIEELCYKVADFITNSDYLWETINDSIAIGIKDCIDDVINEDEYLDYTPTEIGEDNTEEDKPDEN